MALLLFLFLLVAVLATSSHAQYGLPDAVANVGRLFNYDLPNLDPATKFHQFSEIGGDGLPPWLEWDKKESTLAGVPMVNDNGPMYIAVKFANGSRDVFAIDVRDPDEPCDSTTTGTVERVYAVLPMDVNLDQLLPTERVLLMKLANRRWSTVVRTGQLTLGNWRFFKTAQRIWSNADPLKPDLSIQDSEAVFYWTVACQMPLKANETKLIAQLAQQTQNTPTEKMQFLLPDFNKKITIKGLLLVKWEISNLRTKRQFDDDYSRYLASRFGHARFTTELYPQTTTTRRPFTFPPRRPPVQSIRPTSRIDYGSTTATTTSPTTSRFTATLRPVTTDRESPKIEVHLTRTTPTVTTSPFKLDENSRPKVQKSLGTVVCYRGVVCEVRIPDDTFYDREDGSTVMLELSLSALDGGNKSHSDWVYLDKLDRTLYGLNLNTGQWQYSLTATDSAGSAVSDAFAIQVVEPSHETDHAHYNHLFTVTLSEQLDKLSVHPTTLVKLVSKLAEFFGDLSPSAIVVRSLKSGSTVLEWSNGTLFDSACPRSDIGKLTSKMRRKGGGVKSDFYRFMKPEFTVTDVNVAFHGACSDDASRMKSDDEKEDEEEEIPMVLAQPEEGGNALMSTVLPAIIIIVLLVIAGVIACLYYRRSRSTAKKHEEVEKKFLSKGTPIIFPDEVDGDEECTATSPMLLKEDKPPTPMTELSSFQPTSLNGSSTPKSTKANNSTNSYAEVRKQPATTTATSSDDGSCPRITENPLYRPPPPFDSARLADRSPKPRHTNAPFREPPPYVPP
ncbi:Dystroglycan [Trichinella britovi]|uniref:Dystroglycan 1 n=1 Tax=Trichinella britovi TaxID=45882 RepID=A0A0V1DF90_TRIBR|nr:Dystroglycan [Trichinella britovi]